ncbi:protein PIMREG [Molothrus aeneus]
MASVLQNVKATVAWRKHRLLPDLNEDESPVPDKFKRRASLSSLNTIHMSLRKRVPLKPVELNFRVDKTPTRESLEPRQRCQTLQTIKRTAKYAFGTVSQKIQKSCQSPVRSMVTGPAESISRSRATSSTKKRTATPQTPCYKSVTPAASSKGTPKSCKRALLGPTRVSKHREWRDFSSWLGKNGFSLRRSRRAAALKSPYSSPVPSSRKIEFDCELELVSSGICQLKRISQAFDDAIVKEERQQAISNYYYLTARNSQSVHRSLKPSQAIKRQAKKLHQALGT